MEQTLGGQGAKVRLLDVGSIRNPWRHDRIDATCIDPRPHPQHAERVEPLHMLAYFDKWRGGQARRGEEGKERQTSKRGERPEADGLAQRSAASPGYLAPGYFDCVALSMVLNCEGDARKRGRMLAASRDMLRPGGLLLVSLPRACLDNSRFCSQRILLGQMRRLCFKGLRVVHTSRLSLLVFKRRNDVAECDDGGEQEQGGRGEQDLPTGGATASPQSRDSAEAAPSVQEPRPGRGPITNVKRPLRTGQGRNNFRIDF